MTGWLLAIFLNVEQHHNRVRKRLLLNVVLIEPAGAPLVRFHNRFPVFLSINRILGAIPVSPACSPLNSNYLLFLHFTLHSYFLQLTHNSPFLLYLNGFDFNQGIEFSKHFRVSLSQLNQTAAAK